MERASVRRLGSEKSDSCRAPMPQTKGSSTCEGFSRRGGQTPSIRKDLLGSLVSAHAIKEARPVWAARSATWPQASSSTLLEEALELALAQSGNEFRETRLDGELLERDRNFRCRGQDRPCGGSRGFVRAQLRFCHAAWDLEWRRYSRGVGRRCRGRERVARRSFRRLRERPECCPNCHR